MTRYDIAKFYGYNSPEEYDEAEKRKHEIFTESLKKQKPYVEKEPAKIQTVNHGRWICEFYNDVFDVYQADCSICKKESTDKYDKVSESYEYCPHCGARMDLKDGDTNGGIMPDV